MVRWSELEDNEQDYLDWSWEKPEFWREIQYEPEEGDDETNSYNQHICITGEEGAIDHEIKTKDEWEWYREKTNWNQGNINRLINQIPMIGGRIKSTRKHKTTRRKTTRRKTTRRKTTRRKTTRRKTTRRKTTRRKTSKHKVTMRNSKRKNTRRRN